MIAPKVKLDRVDWKGVRRSAQNLVRHLEQHGPLTSHEVIQQLGIARPTFNNAINILRKKKLIVSVDV